MLSKQICTALCEKLNVSPDLLLSVEIPPDPTWADFAIPTFPLAKELGKSPVEIAQQLTEIDWSDTVIEKIEARGPYANIFVKSTTLFTDFPSSPTSLAGQKIMVEYSSPNTNKALLIGHVRNNLIGASVVNIFRELGAEVIAASLVQDRGAHICKSLLAYLKYGNGETPEQTGEKPDHFVHRYYIMFSERKHDDEEAKELLRQWEDDWESGRHDSELITTWQRLNDWVEQGWAETYEVIGSQFDHLYYESQLYTHGRQIIEQALADGKMEKTDDGAVQIDLTDVNLDKKVLLRSNGTSVYMTQDLYTTKVKFDEFNLDRSIWVVADEQRYHFQVLFEICDRLGIADADKMHHLAYGYLYQPEGKVSSRHSMNALADQLIEETVQSATSEVTSRRPDYDDEQKKTIAHQVALAAIKFRLLSTDAMATITFDPRESVRFDGDTGPYLQYATARITKLLSEQEITDQPDLSLLGEETAERQLAVLLHTWPDVLLSAAEHYNPAKIAHFALELTKVFNRFYHDCPILKAETSELAAARLYLTDQVGQTLRRALRLLGITPLEKM